MDHCIAALTNNDWALCVRNRNFSHSLKGIKKNSEKDDTATREESGCGVRDSIESTTDDDGLEDRDKNRDDKRGLVSPCELKASGHAKLGLLPVRDEIRVDFDVCCIFLAGVADFCLRTTNVLLLCA